MINQNCYICQVFSSNFLAEFQSHPSFGKWEGPAEQKPDSAKPLLILKYAPKNTPNREVSLIEYNANTADKFVMRVTDHATECSVSNVRGAAKIVHRRGAAHRLIKNKKAALLV